MRPINKYFVKLALFFCLIFLTSCSKNEISEELETTENSSIYISDSESFTFISESIETSTVIGISEEPITTYQTTDYQYLDSQSAIEIVKQFMAGDNDISMTDGYSFIDNNGLMYDEYGQPYYSIRIRQDAKDGFNSMAIGNVTVNAKTGECSWQ